VRSQFEVGRTGCPSFRAGLLTLLTRPKIALQRANSSQRSLRRILESLPVNSSRGAKIFGNCGVPPQFGADLRLPTLRRNAAATICGRKAALGRRLRRIIWMPKIKIDGLISLPPNPYSMCHVVACQPVSSRAGNIVTTIDLLRPSVCSEGAHAQRP
jgi:hypothetical protein